MLYSHLLLSFFRDIKKYFDPIFFFEEGQIALPVPQSRKEGKLSSNEVYYFNKCSLKIFSFNY